MTTLFCQECGDNEAVKVYKDSSYCNDCFISALMMATKDIDGFYVMDDLPLLDDEESELFDNID